MPKNDGYEEEQLVHSSKTPKIVISTPGRRKKLKFHEDGLIFSIIIFIFLVGLAIYLLFYFGDHPGSEDGVLIHGDKDRNYHLRMVNEINKRQNMWKAKYNPNAAREMDVTMLPMDELEEAMESLKNETVEEFLQDTESHIKQLLSLPDLLPTTFDARRKWPDCFSMREIYDQAGCGSCWAISAASTMSDRICIALGAQQGVLISAEDLLACCPNCGGCVGGVHSIHPFIHFKQHGIVTGGAYNSALGCKPYSFEPKCGTPCSPTTFLAERTPACVKECRPEYGKSYEEDLRKASQAYWVWSDRSSLATAKVWPLLDRLHLGESHGKELIKRELFHFGPVQACMAIDEQFQHYDYGIYTSGDGFSEILYGHCMKLLGWGEQDGKEYWLYANSWGKNWGENGFIRIDINEVPSHTSAGLIYQL